jgi:hypothetical protein
LPPATTTTLGPSINDFCLAHPKPCAARG